MNSWLREHKKNIYIAVTIIWIVVIFSLSLQTADTSTELSSGFLKWMIEVLLSAFVGDYNSLPAEQLEQLHFLVRKGAHFSEYFILGMLVIQSMRQTKLAYKGMFGIAACALVAATDETIQRFVNGRSGQLSDVLLDSAGALCGIGVVVIITKLWQCGIQQRKMNS